MPPRSTQSIRETLQQHGQAHVLAFFDELSAPQQRILLEQIGSIDFAQLDDLIERYVRRAGEAAAGPELQPAPYYPHPANPEHSAQYDAAHYRRVGEDLITAGKVAAFTVAGGQGTRLGWKGPKGTYPATCVTGKPLFRVFAEQILAAQKKYGLSIPWYIMTSPINDAETRAFLLDNNCFGLDPSEITMFPQGLMPSMEIGTGRLLLAERHEIAMNPDGHGGALKALRRSGALEEMAGRGIEHISYFQVDNPLARAIDPLFIGLHAAAPDSSAEVSSKMVPKAYAEEKVGVFCRAQHGSPSREKTMVIEYSDLPGELAQQRDAAGNLRFVAGSIAIHVFSVAFVDRLTEDPERFGLPWHRAEKKVPHVDIDTGRNVDPEKANAVKLETFIFDALPLAESSIVLETSRIEEFAPIKNAEGVDSPATSHQVQSDRNGAWLEHHGVKVPRDREGRVAAKIEISPLTALEPSDLAEIDLPPAIEPGAEVVL